MAHQLGWTSTRMPTAFLTKNSIFYLFNRILVAIEPQMTRLFIYLPTHLDFSSASVDFRRRQADFAQDIHIINFPYAFTRKQARRIRTERHQNVISS